MENGGITPTKQNKKKKSRERDYTGEALTLLNHLKLLMNL